MWLKRISPSYCTKDVDEILIVKHFWDVVGKVSGHEISVHGFCRS